MYPCINMNASPNNNQQITYLEHVSYLVRIHTIPCRIYLQQGYQKERTHINEQGRWWINNTKLRQINN